MALIAMALGAFPVLPLGEYGELLLMMRSSCPHFPTHVGDAHFYLGPARQTTSIWGNVGEERAMPPHAPPAWGIRMLGTPGHRHTVHCPARVGDIVMLDTPSDWHPDVRPRGGYSSILIIIDQC
jgi:hypothetical protein